MPPLKFSSLKCLPYKRTKDPIRCIIHFKMAIAIVCMLEDKRVSIFYKWASIGLDDRAL